MKFTENSTLVRMNIFAVGFLFVGLALSPTANAQWFRNSQDAELAKSEPYFNNPHGTQYRVRSDIVFPPGSNALTFYSRNPRNPNHDPATLYCRLEIPNPPTASQSGYVISKDDTLTIVGSNRTFNDESRETPNRSLRGTDYNQSSHEITLQTSSGTPLRVRCIRNFVRVSHDLGGRSSGVNFFLKASVGDFENLVSGSLQRLSPYTRPSPDAAAGTNTRPDPVRISLSGQNSSNGLSRAVETLGSIQRDGNPCPDQVDNI